jgi:Concanavalin A-like lectin/glucanases superfamily
LIFLPKTAVLGCLLFCLNAATFGADKFDSFKLTNKYLKIFPVVFSADDEEIKCFNASDGTIELWVKFNPAKKSTTTPIFFWGERAWKNSILLQMDSRGILYGRVSSHNWQGQVQIPDKFKLDRWYHLAFQWGTTNNLIDVEKVKLFINGKLVHKKETFHNEKSTDKRYLGGKLLDSAVYYILLGAVKGSRGKLDKKALPDLQISQMRTSKTARYNKNFTPEKVLINDKDTLLLLSTMQGKPEVTFKDQTIEIEEGKF